MQTSINITSETTSGKKVTKSITNINPSIGNTALTTAASLFTAISDTNYIAADRIDKIDLTEDYEPKQTPTLSVDSYGNITYNGDGNLCIQITKEGEYYGRITNNRVECRNENGQAVVTFTGIIAATETNNYSAISTTFNKAN